LLIGRAFPNLIVNLARTRLHTRLAAVLLATSAMFAEAESIANEEFRSALGRGDIDGAARLVASGVDLDTHRSDGKTLLILAARESDVVLVRRLIAAGADVNATTGNGGTALMFAAIRGDVETQAALIDAGADVNAIGGFDWTALMVASVKGHVIAVRQLLASGADPTLRDIYDWTPLMRAVYEDRDEVVEALLEQPVVDLNATNDQGATALHLAAVKGNAALARVLLLAGANPQIQDRKGRTAAVTAVAAGHEDVAVLLGHRASQ
jgi:ankyrin repeat protein